MSACPECGQVKTRVIDTRVLVNGWTKRRRECLDDECEHRWNSYEVPEVSLNVDGIDAENLLPLNR